MYMGIISICCCCCCKKKISDSQWNVPIKTFHKQSTNQPSKMRCFAERKKMAKFVQIDIFVCGAKLEGSEPPFCETPP